MAWLVEHAAWLYNSCHEGRDKKIAIRRLKGGKSVKPVGKFGESVLFKLLLEAGGSKYKLDARLRKGRGWELSPGPERPAWARPTQWSRAGRFGDRLMLRGGIRQLRKE